MEATQNLAPAASSTDSKLHFLDYWRIIRLRKAIILTVLFLVVATVTVVTSFLTPMYMSTAGMRVDKDTPDLLVLGGIGTPQQPFDPYYFNTEFEVLKSHAILDVVITRLKLNVLYATRLKATEVTVQQAYEILSRNVEVKQRKNTSIIEISAYDQDKIVARNIADMVAEVYENYRSSARNLRQSRGLTTLSNELANLDQQLTAAQKVVDDFRAQGIGSGDLSSESSQMVNLLSQTMARLDAAKTQLRTEVAAQEQIVATVRQIKETEPDRLRYFLSSSASLTTPELTQLIGNLNQAAQRLESQSTQLGPEHPDVRTTKGVLNLIVGQIENEVIGITSSLESKLAGNRKQVESLEKDLAEVQNRLAADNAKSAPYIRAKQHLEATQRIRSAMQMEYNQQLINGEMSRASSVQVIDKALPGMKPVKPNKPLFIAAGGVAGLLLGFLLAFFIEYLDTSVKTIDDVEQALGAPVLGVIPQNVGALIKEGPDSPHAEAYRVLRTNILFSRTDPDQRTMTVVSGGAGEGKSTTIFNLATIFAQQGSRVLIVDSDLRRPSLHKILNVANTIGLTNYLLRQMKLEEVVQTTPQAGLDFLPSGKLPSSSVGILNSQQMKEFIAEVRARYDFVFFDSPPIMGVSDASILASEVDMAVLVVQYRKYPQQMTLRAKQMVEKIGGPGCLLGVVLNNINISQDSYYYYYSGYYYDYYSKNEDSKPENEKTGKKRKKSESGSGGSEDTEVKSKY
jgi:polysaccharide biosynthesis transport protein